MTKKFRDPELAYFARHVLATPAGLAYTSAWRGLAAAEARCAAALETGNGKMIEKARQAYIRASQQCSAALDVVEREHAWPPH